jgi:hypothetical protein
MTGRRAHQVKKSLSKRSHRQSNLANTFIKDSTTPTTSKERLSQRPKLSRNLSAPNAPRSARITLSRVKAALGHPAANNLYSRRLASFSAVSADTSTG